jgi:hypothetical protein
VEFIHIFLRPTPFHSDPASGRLGPPIPLQGHHDHYFSTAREIP